MTLLIFLLFFVTPSAAILIGFDPISQTIPVGDPVDVALVISGLGVGDAPSLSIFDVDISFDSAILAFNDVEFGDPLIGDQLDLLAIGSLTGVNSSLGSVNLFELSFDPATILDTLQADSFTLATLTFDTLVVGTSSLDISVNALGDAIGAPLSADLQSGSISPVPEPATILLLASGMAGLGVFSRKSLKK
jgi:hypothetical protein